MRTSIGIAGLALIIGLGIAAPSVRADDQEWHSIATLTVEHVKGHKDVKEVPVGHKFSNLRIVCTSGSVIINSVLVKSNGEKQPHEYAKTLAAKERIDIVVGHDVLVDGLVISDDGTGTYEVFYKK